MKNPFATPETPPQWLLGSVCWTTLCVGGWVLVSSWALEVPYNQKTPHEPVVFLSFLVAYGLVWWKALPGLKATEAGGSWLEVLAFTWLVCLVAFQLLWLVMMLLMLTPPFSYDPENLSN